MGLPKKRSNPYPGVPHKPVVNRTLEMLKKSLKKETERRGAVSTLLSSDGFDKFNNFSNPEEGGQDFSFGVEAKKEPSFVWGS